MKFKDTKVGETYNARVRVLKKGKKTFTAQLASSAKPGDTFVFSEDEMADFSPISPEPAPKYDPCRLFRRGDKVRIKKENLYGRPVFTDHMDFQVGNVYLVAEDETEYGAVTLVSENGNIETYSYLEIELVTMVEEEGLYFIRNNKVGKKFEVRDRKRLQIAATFCYSKTCAHTQNAAQKSALEYCNKLNEGHRKELE